MDPAGTCREHASRASFPSYFADLYDAEPAAGEPAITVRPSGARTRHEPDFQAFIARGERMLRHARRNGQRLSLLVIQFPDLPELQALFGRDAADEAVRVIMEVLCKVAGQKSLAIRTQADTFALVLRRCTGQLGAVLRRWLAQAYSVELDWSGEEIVLVPDVQAAVINDGDSVAATYSAVCAAIRAKRHHEELRREYLRREREAHSAHLAAAPQATRAPAMKPSAWCATLPAPMALRPGRR